ncbi:MAG TPA: ATP-binding protein [Bauldia sp.]|nr:ATP-binding protein [Bauldia sp.]
MRRHGERRGAIRAAGPALALLAALASLNPAVAATESLLDAIDPSRVVLAAVVIGVVGFAVLSSVALMRARSRAEAENVELKGLVGNLKAEADRAEALVNSDDQYIVAWGAPGEPPLVAGRLTSVPEAPVEREAVIRFASWLQPESVQRLERGIARLRERGEAFTLTLATSASRIIEAVGRTVGGLAVVRFRDLSGDRLARAEIQAEHEMLIGEVGAMKAMLSAAPMPIWLRDGQGRLTWVNEAYAAAVEADDGGAAVERGIELLDTASRNVIRDAHHGDPVFLRRMPAIVAGTRRIFDVADIASAGGSAGIAVDVTATEEAEAALRREVDFNARTLDQLATAVAIFGSDRRLRSYNAAYRSLFDLDAAFLDSHPEENAVLDRLRQARKLPEQADFRTWRADLLAAYRSLESREHWWHLPDGQTLRVIANPNPQGGMTWVYENVTERLDLESRYNALIHVQGETLDHLTEGVAVFGSDGKLRLHNPSFAVIWNLDHRLLDREPHVAEIVEACRQSGDNAAEWTRFTAAVAGLDETRSSVSGRMERADAHVIDYAAIPLPDGQTMVTFVDVTDSLEKARALTERNEALEAADALKNAFIHHVSYELRSPLTNIIGFTQLLADPRVGSLNPRQREYVGYVMSSSDALLALVNDILDLATIDAGIMELELGEVDVAGVVAAAVDGLKDRLAEKRITLRQEIDPRSGSLIADAKRVRQILSNLIANAIGFSPDGGEVRIAAAREGGEIVFTISDQGPGMPPDFASRAFEPFASRSQGAARGGVGLGLTIVKSFVSLHGGTVEIASAEGQGSTVTVRLPLRPAATAAAAE